MLGWLLGFLWLAALKAWLGAHLALDGDALVVADIWNSLHSGGHLGAWAMGPQPYLFPDLLIYGISAQWCPDPLGRQLWHGMILGFLLWWFLARLMKRVWNLDGSRARAYAAAGLLLLLPCLDGAKGLDGALVPGYHGGALLCGMAFMTWALGQDRRLSSWVAVLWAAFLVGITWASDQIVPAWVLLPGLTLSLGKSGRARRRIWGAAALSAAFRWAALWYWKSLGMQVAHFQWSYFGAHWLPLLQAFAGRTLDAAGTPSVAAMLAALALLLLLRPSRFRDRPVEGWFAVSLALMALSALAVSALEGSFAGRYFAGFIWLSVPMVPLELGKRMGRFNGWRPNWPPEAWRAVWRIMTTPASCACSAAKRCRPPPRWWFRGACSPMSGWWTAACSRRSTRSSSCWWMGWIRRPSLRLSGRRRRCSTGPARNCGCIPAFELFTQKSPRLYCFGWRRRE